MANFFEKLFRKKGLKYEIVEERIKMTLILRNLLKKNFKTNLILIIFFEYFTENILNLSFYGQKQGSQRRFFKTFNR